MRALILGGSPAVAATLRQGLRAAGADVATVGAAEADPLDRAATTAAALRAAGPGTPDLVVIPAVDPAGYAVHPLAETGEEEWLERCERPLKAGRIALQAAFELLKGKGDSGGGRVVVLIPNIAMTGAEGLAPAAAVAEGMRCLAKSAARLWGARNRITVNTLAVFVEQLAPEAGVKREPSLPAPPLPVPDLSHDVAALMALMAAPAAGIVTGATLVVDGGALMSI
jgi:NAD(P)-dependent dehydrogenase (short-subunit alcohol dehydrogenase family)